jgi:hypothetical protein
MKRISVNVKMDSRYRVCLAKLTKNAGSSFRAYEDNGKIILEPLIEIPADEAWLFKPENKEVLERIQDAFKEKKRIDRGSFAKYVKTK